MNRRFFKYPFFLALLALAVYGGGRLFFKLTDGFTMSNIQSEFAYRDDWQEPELNEEQLNNIKIILDQDFHYLGRGAQAYAFLSEDGDYVLKIVKQKHLKMMAWEKGLFSIPFLSGFREKKIVRMRSKIENVLESSKISYQRLKAETALLYLHFKPTDFLNLKVNITDKLGIKHLIDLDGMEFCLQKRAELALPYIEKLLENNKEKAKKALFDMLDLRKQISLRGIKDKDTGFLNNMGFIDGQPIVIDIGQFALDEEIKKPENFKRDLDRKTLVLRSWLKDNQPDLVQALEDHVAGFTEQTSNYVD